jgi:hypothetical protein
MGATKILPSCLDALTYHLEAALISRRGEHLNGAFEAVEDVAAAANDNLKRPLIIIAAQLTLGHGFLHAM